MKKLLYLMLACVLCCALVFTACSSDSEERAAETTETEAVETEAGVTQADIEENIIGKWILTDRDGQPVTTNEKAVYTFESDKKASISASFTSVPKAGERWLEEVPADVIISGDTVTLMSFLDDETVAAEEFTITDINSDEFSAKHEVAISNGSSEESSDEKAVRFVKVGADYKKDIIGTWEGRCTSVGATYDDGQVHRWEYKDDGTYVYYIKDGDKWVPSDNTLNEYFVDGNLLCTRWNEGKSKNHEWWEIAIDGDKMNWTAQRPDDGDKTFTVTFEMTRVE